MQVFDNIDFIYSSQLKNNKLRELNAYITVRYVWNDQMILTIFELNIIQFHIFLVFFFRKMSKELFSEKS
jgi:hypothetical protein